MDPDPGGPKTSRSGSGTLLLKTVVFKDFSTLPGLKQRIFSVTSCKFTYIEQRIVRKGYPKLFSTIEWILGMPAVLQDNKATGRCQGNLA
jgi:hypothetical protein